MKKILIHGSGHKAASWDKVISYMNNDKDILCPNLSTILNGKEASYDNLYNSFVEYCNKIDGKIDLCGLSLGGILALNFAIDYPNKVEKLVLIGTPYRVPKVMFSIQNVIFKFLPKKLFETVNTPLDTDSPLISEAASPDPSLLFHVIVTPDSEALNCLLSPEYEK